MSKIDEVYTDFRMAAYDLANPDFNTFREWTSEARSDLISKYWQRLEVAVRRRYVTLIPEISERLNRLSGTHAGEEVAAVHSRCKSEMPNPLPKILPAGTLMALGDQYGERTLKEAVLTEFDAPSLDLMRSYKLRHYVEEDQKGTIDPEYVDWSTVRT